MPDYFYKVESDGDEYGPALALFSAVYSDDLLSATIYYDTTKPQPELYWFVMHAGQGQIYYVWNIQNWNAAAYDSIVFSNPILGDNGKPKEISTLSLTGKSGSDGPKPTPDGGMTLILLGLGTIILSGFRRFVRK